VAYSLLAEAEDRGGRASLAPVVERVRLGVARLRT